MNFVRVSMSNITQEWLNNYSKKRYELINMKYEMIERAKEVLIWENQNIGTNHDINENGVTYYYDFDVDSEGIYLKVYSTWAYGGHDEEEIFIPYNKLLNDEWKEKALINYRNQQRIKNKKAEEQKEMAERAELKRLKEKYGE